AECGEFVLPEFVLVEVVVFAALELVDRIDAFFFRGNDFAPLADVGGQVGGFRRAYRDFAAGVIFVGVHATAGSMDDEDALVAGLGQDGVHPRRDLDAAADGVETVVRIPHVADDNGRVSRL